MTRVLFRIAVIALAATMLPLASGAGAAESVTGSRVAGTDRHATAAALALDAFPDGASEVVLARGDAFPDALAGSFLAGAVGGPVLLTAGDALSDAAADALEDLDAGTVHVLGGTGAVSASVTAQLTADGYVVRRVAGASRYETATRVAAAGRESIGELDGKRTALLASGADFPDALAAGPLAFAAKLPILLTAPDALSDETAAALEDLAIEHVVVVGGTAAVSDAAVAAVTAAGITNERLAGANRTETAVAIADFALARLGFPGTTVRLARGDAFPDGLAGGPHGGSALAPILLTDPATLSAETGAWLTEHADTVTTITALGGTAAVSDDTLAAARAAAGDVGAAGGFAVVGEPATTELGASRSCRVVADAGASVNLRVLPAEFVTVTEGGLPTFIDADGDLVADALSTAAGIATVEGRTLSPPASELNDVASDGDIAIELSSDVYESVVLVAFTDVEGATAGALDVSESGAATEPVAVACRTLFAPPEAERGAHTAVAVGSVDVIDGVFTNASESVIFRFDSADTFLLDGESSGPEEFASLLSRGDVIDIDYVPGDVSSFDVLDDTVQPAATPDVLADERDVTVSFAIPDSNGSGTKYHVFRVRTQLLNDGCSATNAETGRTVGTAVRSPYEDVGVDDGCWKYRIISVASSGLTEVSTFSDPVRVPGTPPAGDTTRPTSKRATVADAGTAGFLDGGDTITIAFSEALATPAAGASVRVVDGNSTSATFTAGSGSTFALNTSSTTVDGVQYAPGAVLTITITTGPTPPVGLPANVINSSGITDVAGNAWDLTGSQDRTLEST